MNIILLSGGSGKRLWPLSNDIRSKQFIKLFKDETGDYESMVQRVYRQITTVDAKAKVTIATSKSQVSAILNQLGEQVNVCVEPCRRDTFPAIALAAAYLHDVQGVGREECVAVCPVDPYVDNSYYEGVVRLEELVLAGEANLTLMGIEPTYPSEKYGYIIPKHKETVSPVLEFKEKPTVKAAEEYLSRGALWNAGVFAFRLGYLLDIARNWLHYTDYQDLYDRYGELPKISFDYAVVEKESSIQVMRYAGDWKDVGTWNMMTEVMSDDKLGNVTIDENCVDTNVVNELDIPVLCMGCRNLVVAVSNDGILVADKNQSSYMKPYVESIGGVVKYAEKSWGSYTVIDMQPQSQTVRVNLTPGHRMKYHSHQHREEVWTVVSGRGRVILDGLMQEVAAGSVIHLPVGCKHTVIADSDLHLIEVQIGKDISVKDKTVYSFDEIHDIQK